jgi:hypothetical protein
MSPFDGRETGAWLAFDVPFSNEEPLPASLLDPFKVRAETLGCRTERLGNRVNSGFLGYGLVAYCEHGGVALIARRHGMTVGCEKPTTRAACEGLLGEISDTPQRFRPHWAEP